MKKLISQKGKKFVKNCLKKFVGLSICNIHNNYNKSNFFYFSSFFACKYSKNTLTSVYARAPSGTKINAVQCPKLTVAKSWRHKIT